jgi:ABC-type nickel/cobalt efflux system permease component RcnA
VGSTRGGARRAAKPKRTVQPRVIGLGLAAFVALVGWAVLVWVAIHFGRSARSGESGQWAYLAAASVGAVVCLFVCLWLVTVLLRRVGILEDNRRREPHRRTDQPHRHVDQTHGHHHQPHRH